MNIIPLKLSVTTCYLLAHSDKYILVDTGYEVDWNLFCKQLKNVQVDFSQISHILLTHHDDDHSGLLNRIITRNSTIHVVMSRRAKDLLATGKDDRSHGKKLINKRLKLLWALSLKRLKILLSTGKYITKKNDGKFPPYYVRSKDLLITNETRLKDIGIDLEGTIIETPGHTIDSITLILDDGNAFVGDAAANMLQFAGTNYCVIALEDFDQYYQSWQKIIDYNAQHIFPAHGSPFPVEKLKQNIGKNTRSTQL
ncbi:MBL fold metallo-hydrolase [Sporomusa acidovorans]|uniref:Metallo-beta-lactamase domain-containing protein n=1 Tax=Sporomusa acidovorans (strain ATCC 49682 / DSM 3132 / Mol) TaxID=1123286 RepID=A0ABZ3IYW1_SPOA4|nr:MBL fold metallo-hydrolase [Sporomusa acidovorans]OZC16949.1 hydroxyacylglutathione hydrolase [Sporomusa acidovorans DSM 3132]SDE13549.1 Glyoxylase, beta-lactamase superfamily II [Sporomusa acidovorans]